MVHSRNVIKKVPMSICRAGRRGNNRQQKYINNHGIFRKHRPSIPQSQLGKCQQTTRTTQNTQNMHYIPNPRPPDKPPHIGMMSGLTVAACLGYLVGNHSS
jgi:hypothetical protein